MKINLRVLSILLPAIAIGVACSGSESDSGPSPSGSGDGDGDGDGDETTKEDPDGSGGSDNEGMGGGDDEPLCEAGLVECAGAAATRTCADDGASWEKENCRDRYLCEAGECVPPNGWVCIPGEKGCDEDRTRTCKQDGSGWDEASCPGETECSQGECFGSVCQVGATRCSDEFLDPGIYFTDWVAEDGGDEWDAFDDAVEAMPAGQLERCVDGESWTVESCDEGEICVQSGIDLADAQAYRDALAPYLRDMLDGEEGDPPTPPVVPAGSVATCEDVACPNLGADEVYLETSLEGQRCGDPTYTGPFDPSIAYGTYNKCEGIAPYGEVEFEVVTCGDMEMCTRPAHEIYTCREVECFRGESECVSSSTFRGCNSLGQWNSPSACVGSSTCIDSGDYPDREHTCRPNGAQE